MPAARTLDVACGTGWLTQHLPGEISGLDASTSMLEIARERVPEGEFRRRRCAHAAVRGRILRPAGDGPLLRASGGGGASAVPRRSPASRKGARRRRLARCTRTSSRWSGRSACSRMDRGGRSTSGTSPARSSSRSSAAARCSSKAAGSSSCARPLDAATLVVPVARLSPARQPGVPGMRRRRLSDSSRGRCSRATRASARTSSARRRESSRARSAGPGAAARDRRCGAGCGSRRTPSTRRSTARRSLAAIRVARQAAAATGRRLRREQELCAFWREWELRLLRPRLIVPVGGLAIRRLLGLASLDASVGERFEYGRGCCRPAPASVRCQPLAERSREPGAARAGGRARPRGAGSARRRPLGRYSQPPPRESA